MRHSCDGNRREGLLRSECCSSGVKIVMPRLTSCWDGRRFSTHHLYPLGQSIQRASSPFCTNSSKLVSPRRTASPSEYILFCSFLSQGPKYKSKTKRNKKKQSNVQHKIFNTRPSAKKVTASFTLEPKGFWVSFIILNRDNYLDVSS